MRTNLLTLGVIVIQACILWPANSMAQKPVLIYLHGMIVENQGLDAHHPEYGDYEFENILENFRKAGFEVIGELRPSNTDVSDYADHVTAQVRELTENGVPPNKITVLGASKGSVIAMVASTRLARSDVNFIFMAACNEWVGNNLNLSPCGRILSIYEESDEVGRSCHEIIKNSACVTEYKEIMLSTGLKHGFLFKPLSEWVEPALQWANFTP